MLRNNRVLWAIQILLAALYLFAGGFKLFGPAEAMAPPGQPQPLPIWFLRMIGGLEMLGAVITTAATMSVALAVLPLITGALDLVVLNGRWDWMSAPARASRRSIAKRRASAASPRH